MYKIILVDDDLITLEGIQKHIPFKELDLQLCAVCQNGAEGLEAIKKHRPDIIFSDIQMPQMTGFEMIKCLEALSLKPQIIMFTGFDDFENVKCAIDQNVSSYLVKPATPDEITKALKKAVEARKVKNKSFSALKEQNTDRLLHGYNFDDAELENLKTEYGINLEDGHFRCVQISFFESPAFENEQFLKNFEDNLKKSFSVYRGTISDNRINYLLSSPCELLCQNLSKIAEDMLLEYNFDVFVTVGQEAKSIKEISESHKTAADMQKYAFCFDNRGYMVFEDLKKLQNSLKQSVTFDKDTLFTAVTFGNAHIVTEILNELENSLKKNIVYDSARIKNLAFEFCTILFSKKERFPENSIDEQNVWQTINSISSQKKLFEYLKEITGFFANTTQDDTASTEEMTVKIILDYIGKNYMHSISHASLARMLFCSRNYLRQIFIRHVGVDLKVYLKNFRMEKAGEFLRNTQQNFIDIAEQVGYHDIKTFRAAFIEYYGMLPSEYRKKITE